jgi:hypothetical protein
MGEWEKKNRDQLRRGQSPVKQLTNYRLEWAGPIEKSRIIRVSDQAVIVKNPFLVNGQPAAVASFQRPGPGIHVKRAEGYQIFTTLRYGQKITIFWRSQWLPTTWIGPCNLRHAKS